MDCSVTVKSKEEKSGQVSHPESDKLFNESPFHLVCEYQIENRHNPSQKKKENFL